MGWKLCVWWEDEGFRRAFLFYEGDTLRIILYYTTSTRTQVHIVLFIYSHKVHNKVHISYSHSHPFLLLFLLLFGYILCPSPSTSDFNTQTIIHPLSKSQLNPHYSTPPGLSKSHPSWLLRKLKIIFWSWLILYYTQARV